MNSHILFTDGGSRGNPGPSGAGFVLCDATGKVVLDGQKFLGERTNNQAEYEALLLGLQAAVKQDLKELRVYMDSNLIVEQMKGNWKVKNAELKPLHEQAKMILLPFTKISFHHIPREKNTQADALANQAMDRAR